MDLEKEQDAREHDKHSGFQVQATLIPTRISFTIGSTYKIGFYMYFL